MPKFIFDLDGTLTKEETLPLIASHFGLETEISSMTAQTIGGQIPFIESFIKRVFILGKFPVDQIAQLLVGIPLYEELKNFIDLHRNDCYIATGNLDCWIGPLAQKIGCRLFCSQARVVNNQVEKIEKILRKEDLVAEIKKNGDKVVFIGDGNNDTEAMRLSDCAIASGLTHSPASSVLSVSDYVVYDEKALCRLLNQLS